MTGPAQFIVKPCGGSIVHMKRPQEVMPANPDRLGAYIANAVGSSRVDLQACKLEYSIVSPK